MALNWFNMTHYSIYFRNVSFTPKPLLPLKLNHVSSAALPNLQRLVAVLAAST